LKSVLCGVVAPEAAGWFRNEITEAGDLKGPELATMNA
jgi:hypothetical protein